MARTADELFPELFIRLSEIESTNSMHDSTDQHSSRRPRLQWIPTGNKRDFRIVKLWGWHHYVHGWRPGEQNTFTPVPDDDLPKHFRPHDTCSMFYSTELSTFLHVPYDCTAKNASEHSTYERDRWDRISFGRPTPAVVQRYPNLWILGHALASTQMDSIVNITDSWNSLILPGSFENGIQRKNTSPTCELAGKLAMILGAVAFSTGRGDVISMIQESFRAPRTSWYVPAWMRHPLCEKDQGLINRRGVVVDVAFDAAKYKQQQLVDWEWGFRGPILSSNPAWDNRHCPFGSTTRQFQHAT